MKLIFSFALCFGISLSFAQTDPQQNNNPDEMNEYNETVADDESGQQYNQGTNADWDRSDFYETRKEPERVTYYSGGHRGTNIINPINNKREHEENTRGFGSEHQFPDVVRYYSGGYYGNNIINRKAVDRVKDAYYDNPVNHQEREIYQDTNNQEINDTQNQIE